jgi:ribosomal protein S18 acetylase RimI-like enzyme
VTGGAVRIRQAQLADYEALGRLFLEVDELHARLLPAYFRRPRGTARSRELIGRILSAPDETILVAHEDGELLGLVHVQLYDTPPIAVMVPRRRAHVDNVVVAAAARRRGVGRRLMEGAARWARDRGAEELLLTVWAGNEEAERFYDALGFHAVNRVLGKPL